MSFGEQVGIGTTLTAALDDVLGISSSQADDVTPGSGVTGGTGGTGGQVSGDVRQLLRQAEAKFAAAQKALQAGDLKGYATAQDDARALVQRALVAAGKTTPSASPSPSGVRQSLGVALELAPAGPLDFESASGVP